LRDKAATGRVDKRLALVGGASALAPCCVINDDDGGLVISVGLETLLKGGDKSPLAEYNATFVRLQKRRRMAPVTAETTKSAQESMSGKDNQPTCEDSPSKSHPTTSPKFPVLLCSHSKPPKSIQGKRMVKSTNLRSWSKLWMT